MSTLPHVKLDVKPARLTYKWLVLIGNTVMGKFSTYDVAQNLCNSLLARKEVV